MRFKALRPMKDPRAEYRTRRLLPGDDFELPDNKQGRLIGRVLQARRWATEMRPVADVPAPPVAIAKQIAAAVVVPPNDPNPPAIPPNDPAAPPTIADVRSEYESALGKRPFMGWDIPTLREKMMAARS